jgi:hypothetical protein
MGKTAERTHPELWEEVKDEVKRGSKGGEAGEWSARKAQLAVQEYKKRGGGYRGGKAEDNSPTPKSSPKPSPTKPSPTTPWAGDDWGTAATKPAGETGERYLPQEARDAVGDEDYRATGERQRDDPLKGRTFSPQPRDVAAKSARFRHAARAEKLRVRTKADMLREAKQLEISGRSRMDKEELAQAIRYAKH